MLLSLLIVLAVALGLALLVWNISTDPASDLDADAERVAESMSVTSARSTADAARVAEELLVELQRR